MEISRSTSATTATAFLTFLEKPHRSGLQQLLHRHHHHRHHHRQHAHFHVLRRSSVDSGFISLEHNNNNNNNNNGPCSGSLAVATTILTRGGGGGLLRRSSSLDSATIGNFVSMRERVVKSDCEEEDEDDVPSSPTGEGTVVTPSSQSFMTSLTPRQKAVSRCLFGPPDPSSGIFAKQKVAEMKEQDKLKWGFDFDNEVPLNSKSQKWIWKKVPSLHRGNSTSEASEESSEDTETEIDTEPEEGEPKSLLHSSSSSSGSIGVPRGGATLSRDRVYEDVNATTSNNSSSGSSSACVVVNVNSQEEYVIRGEQSSSSSESASSPPPPPTPTKKIKLQQKQSSILEYMRPTKKRAAPVSPTSEPSATAEKKAAL